jgi:hypothetical protein
VPLFREAANAQYEMLKGGHGPWRNAITGIVPGALARTVGSQTDKDPAQFHRITKTAPPLLRCWRASHAALDDVAPPSAFRSPSHPSAHRIGGV